jgi:hypothetical protein
VHGGESTVVQCMPFRQCDCRRHAIGLGLQCRCSRRCGNKHKGKEKGMGRVGRDELVLAAMADAHGVDTRSGANEVVEVPRAAA